MTLSYDDLSFSVYSIKLDDGRKEHFSWEVGFARQVILIPSSGSGAVKMKFAATADAVLYLRSSPPPQKTEQPNRTLIEQCQQFGVIFSSLMPSLCQRTGSFDGICGQTQVQQHTHGVEMHTDGG